MPFWVSRRLKIRVKFRSGCVAVLFMILGSICGVRFVSQNAYKCFYFCVEKAAPQRMPRGACPLSGVTLGFCLLHIWVCKRGCRRGVSHFRKSASAGWPQLVHCIKHMEAGNGARPRHASPCKHGGGYRCIIIPQTAFRL